MKLIQSRHNKDGSVNVTVRLAPGEKAVVGNGIARPIVAHVEPVMVNTRHHYRLGGQVDDVVASHVLTEAVPVYWCSIEQKWVDA